MPRIEQRFRLEDSSPDEAAAAVEALRVSLAHLDVKANSGRYDPLEVIVLVDVDVPAPKAKVRAVEAVTAALDKTALKGKYSAIGLTER